MDKAAIILCSSIIRHFLINYARPLISSLVAIKVVYDWLKDLPGKTEPVCYSLLIMMSLLQLTDSSIAYLMNNVVPYFFSQLKSILAVHSSTSQHLLSLPSSFNPESPIFPLFSSQPMSLVAYCQKESITSMTLPSWGQRAWEFHVGNAKDQIDKFIACIGRWLVEQSSGQRVILAKL